MSDLSFDNNREPQNYNNRFNNVARKTPVLHRLLISSGLAKDEQKADKILIAISIALIVFAIVFYVYKMRTPSVKVIRLQPHPVVEKNATTTKSQSTVSSKKI